MIGLLQRVLQASVAVNQNSLGKINTGLLVFVGIEKDDLPKQADRLLERLLGYRVFADEQGKMNLSLTDINGGLMLVPQFTLPADTHKGMRPSFSSAAAPEQGKKLFTYLLQQARNKHHTVIAGEFGADMQVSLVNDGPVTFWLQV
jgi:D-aminoacyl-tRNA deacylase